MPSLLVTRTYSSAARRARSFDSSTLMPPNSTNGALLLHSTVGVILTVDMASPWFATGILQRRGPRPPRGGIPRPLAPAHAVHDRTHLAAPRRPSASAGGPE